MNLLENTDKKVALVILSGCPGAGKSTWGKKFSIDSGVVYVSTDEIRKELSGDESNQSVSANAFAIARRRVSNALSIGKSVMIDATNVNKKARKDWIDLGKTHNAYIVAVAFEVSKAELIKRDTNRERHVGEEIITRFFDKYERPSTEEMIDKIIVK